MPFYFPHSLKVKSPRSRHQQIWCLMRNHLFTDRPLLTVTSHGRRSPGSLSHFFYKDTNPTQKSFTFKISSSFIIVTSQRLHLRILKQWRLGFQQMNLGWGGMWTETFSPSQMDRSTISEAKRRNTWNSGRNDSNWPENVVLGSINHKSTQRSSRVVWNVKSESWGLLLQAEKFKKSTSDKLSTEVRMLSFVLPQTSSVSFLT